MLKTATRTQGQAYERMPLLRRFTTPTTQAKVHVTTTRSTQRGEQHGRGRERKAVRSSDTSRRLLCLLYNLLDCLRELRRVHLSVGAGELEQVRVWAFAGGDS